MGSSKLVSFDIKMYGIGNFKKEILHILTTKSEMIEKEKEIVTDEFRKRHDTYNVKCGGDGFGMMGVKMTNRSPISEETKKKISNTLKGRYPSDETRKKLSAAQKKRKWTPISDLHKERISKANKGKPKPERTEEHKQNISIAKTGKKIAPHSEEHKKNIRIGTRGINKGPKTPEHLKKIGLANKGQTRSPEIKRKMSEAQQRSRYKKKIALFQSLIFEIIKLKSQ
jgi:hypothetical protein